jgi:ABC-type transport system involved in multi-copper enzyme maturation permease subunit
MMIQTLALFVDAYRELNAKKMFWIVLILTALVLAAFATLGVSGDQITLLWYTPFGHAPQSLFIYKTIFSYVVVGIWFTWIAVLLALISTAGVFPEFISAGAIDLYLAKPISRLRLFFTKFLAALLFVLLQVAFFTIVSFFILGIRAHVWQPGIFWAIPLILLLFSYLFAICVLLGVMTRSTVAALLLTLLAWFGLWAMDRVDVFMLQYINQQHTTHQDLDDQIARIDKRIAADPSVATRPAPKGWNVWTFNRRSNSPSSTTGDETLQQSRDRLANLRNDATVPPAFETVHDAVVLVKSFVPKTRETSNLLNRVLFSDADLQTTTRPADDPQPEDFERQREQRRAGQWIDPTRNRSAFWVIGTSLLFEAAALTLAAWLFCRRDY